MEACFCLRVHNTEGDCEKVSNKCYAFWEKYKPQLLDKIKVTRIKAAIVRFMNYQSQKHKKLIKSRIDKDTFVRNKKLQLHYVVEIMGTTYICEI